MEPSGSRGKNSVDGVEVPHLAAIDPSTPATAEAFARLAIELHDAPTVEETVEAVVEFAIQAEACAYAGIALAARGRRAEVAAVTDPAIEALYKAQIDAGSGPMISALTEGTIVLVPDVATEARWPEWSRSALDLGLRSVLNVPMFEGCQTIGVLSLYRIDPSGFTLDDEAVAHILARHASVAVASARQEVSMGQAIDARKLVGQAMGILMERYDLDSDRAFAVLRRYSQDTNTKLHDVAQQLVDTRRLPDQS